jgi:FSR family fosmidomycin resistance protein-like MFS transporter
MTQATDLAFTTRRAGDFRLIGVVSAAHFVSHYYILVLPPLFAFIKLEYDVSYTELGLAFTVFNAVSAVLQTPAGFLVDRVNARLVLVVGLLCGALGLAVASLVHSYWVLIAMFGLMGIGNTVYHPADYAMLSRHVSAERVSQAYSIHTFAGLAGGAAAPASLLLLHSYFGWRGAFMGAAIFGSLVAVVLLLQRDEAPERPAAKPRDGAPAVDTSWRLLLSAPILFNFVFFMLLSMTNFGLMNFSVVALGALHGTSAVTANTALSSNLVLGAIGVLAGGWLAARTDRHALIAAFSMLVTTSACLLMASFDLGTVLLILVMSVSGFTTGALMPSRDMLVRDVTPPGAFGRVFGFVTNGFNIAGMMSPLICGALMDRGEPRAVFLLLAATAVLAIVTVVSMPRRPAA